MNNAIKGNSANNLKGEHLGHDTYKTYKEELEEGIATSELLDDLVDEWHEGNTITSHSTCS